MTMLVSRPATNYALLITQYVLCILLLSGCGEPVEPPPPVYLRIAGSTAMQPLLEELAAAYMQKYSHVTIEVSGGGSRLGLEAVREGHIDIGATSWLTPQETRFLGENGFLSAAIARDGLALIVHPANGVKGLTLREARDLLSGRILRWEEIGGAPGEVQAVSREDGSGDREAFESLVMEGKRVTLNAVVMPSSQAVREYVAGQSNAIGYISMGYVNSSVRAVPLEGLLPMPENVSTGEYKLSRDFILLTRPAPPESVKGFIDFVLSPQGQAIVGVQYGRVH
jgi:phosphate transport system substrate-binding protein